MNTSRLLKIMSSESKARIIFKLLSCDHEKLHLINVNELSKEFNLKQSNLSKHLMDLRNENIVEFEKDGKLSYYKLNSEFRKENEELIRSIAEHANCKILTIQQCKMDKTN